MRPAVAFDLDSTICDTHHRHHLAHMPEPDWEEYSMHCADDTPVPAMHELIRALDTTYDLLIISGRDVCALELTQQWLRRHKIYAKEIHLRAAGRSHVRNEVDKVAAVERLREHYDIRLMIDDWPPVGPVMEAIGIPALIVQPPQCPCGESASMADELASNSIKMHL